MTKEAHPSHKARAVKFPPKGHISYYIALEIMIQKKLSDMQTCLQVRQGAAGILCSKTVPQAGVDA